MDVAFTHYCVGYYEFDEITVKFDGMSTVTLVKETKKLVKSKKF